MLNPKRLEETGRRDKRWSFDRHIDINVWHWKGSYIYVEPDVPSISKSSQIARLAIRGMPTLECVLTSCP
jgi:hypothetical protein